MAGLFSVSNQRLRHPHAIHRRGDNPSRIARTLPSRVELTHADAFQRVGISWDADGRGTARLDAGHHGVRQVEAAQLFFDDGHRGLESIAHVRWEEFVEVGPGDAGEIGRLYFAGSLAGALLQKVA